MSSSSKRQLPNGNIESSEKIRHLNSALIVRKFSQIKNKN